MRVVVVYRRKLKVGLESTRGVPLAGIVVGTLDGLVDGSLAGLLFAWLYNLFCELPRHT
jgi:hypothetical protein